jgi:hypothetical protein
MAKSQRPVVMDKLSSSACDHFRDMTQPILSLNLGFIDKWPHVNFANNVVYLYNIEQ